MLANELSAVIFDLDNTLVSSRLNFNEIRRLLTCPSDIDLLDYLDSLPSTEQKAAKQLVIDHEMADAHQAQKLAGTDQLLTLLSRLEIPCAIVTRNCQQAAMVKIENNAIDIPLLITREDHKAKPAPDALLYLAKYWNKSPQNILYVGDYLYDLQAAQNANTMSCLVSYGEIVDYADLANVVVNDLTELSQIIALKFNDKVNENCE